MRASPGYVRFKFTHREKLQLNFLFISYNWRQENDIWPVHGCYWQFCGRYRGNLLKIYSTVVKLLNLWFKLILHSITKCLKVLSIAIFELLLPFGIYLILSSVTNKFFQCQNIWHVKFFYIYLFVCLFIYLWMFICSGFVLTFDIFVCVISFHSCLLFDCLILLFLFGWFLFGWLFGCLFVCWLVF